MTNLKDVQKRYLITEGTPFSRKVMMPEKIHFKMTNLKNVQKGI